MSSVLKVDAIQNTAGTSGLTIDSNGFVLPKAIAFSAYKSSDQSLVASTWTKITFDTEEFDTASFYDTSTSRFQPTTAGYYLITASLAFLSGTGNAVLTRVYKNGSFFRNASYHYHSASNLDDVQNYASILMYLNGTDYVEIYGLGIGLVTINSGTTYSSFQGHLVGV